MGSHTADAHTEPDPYSQKLLSALPMSPRLRTRPWWFPIEELSNPMVFNMEASVAERIIGQDQAEMSEIEWMTQALISVDPDNSGNLAEITICGRPSAQTRMKNILLHMEAWQKETEARRAKKIKQVEELLKTPASSIISNSSVKGQTELKLPGSLLLLE
ncbi:oocyte-expressed protein homolog [Arvicanthis niloticus]|uniref:oocyte-expressed protein homolog n=1 Tax=Arvicanthis niloticus TaxID=61156 RepID=UPI00148662B8|nr:oocyte-expressed protein homolog [Arvicanthis niloticus]